MADKHAFEEERLIEWETKDAKRVAGARSTRARLLKRLGGGRGDGALPRAHTYSKR